MKNKLLERDRRMVGQLIDPDKFSDESLDQAVKYSSGAGVDFFLAGGSITSNHIEILIEKIKERTSKPVVLFPGNLVQLTASADAVFLLSLISGRNPELLIGNHVVAAPFLKAIRERVIPVGYILIDCGGRTSVEYMSQTSPIPFDKPEIAVATALAGEMLGMKAIYLEGGSGALKPVNPEIIKAVREEITVPLITGGGLNTAEKISAAYEAGADVIIIGNGCESNVMLIRDACAVRDSMNRHNKSL